MEDRMGYWPLMDKWHPYYPRLPYVDFCLPSREEVISISNGRFTIESTSKIALDWNIVAYILACDFYDMMTPCALHLLNTYDVSELVEADWLAGRVLLYYRVYAQYRSGLKPLRMSNYVYALIGGPGPLYHDLYPALQYLWLTPHVSDFESVLGNKRDASGSDAAEHLTLVRERCIQRLVVYEFGDNRTDRDFLFVNVDKYYDLPREVHLQHKLAVSKRVTWDAELPRVSLPGCDDAWLRMHLKDDTAITASFLAERPGLVEYVWGYAYTHCLPRTAALCAAAHSFCGGSVVYELCDAAFYEEIIGRIEGAKDFAHAVILLLRMRDGTLTRDVLHALYPGLPPKYKRRLVMDVVTARFDMSVYSLLYPYIFQHFDAEAAAAPPSCICLLNIAHLVEPGPVHRVYLGNGTVSIVTPHKQLLEYFIFRDSSAA